MDFTHVYNSPLGKITLASDGKNLVGLWFDDGRFFVKDFLMKWKNFDLRRDCEADCGGR